MASCMLRRHTVTHHRALIGDSDHQAVIVCDSVRKGFGTRTIANEVALKEQGTLLAGGISGPPIGPMAPIPSLVNGLSMGHYGVSIPSHSPLPPMALQYVLKGPNSPSATVDETAGPRCKYSCTCIKTSALSA